jgi:release factor glutamine methyltransferase
MLVEEIVKEAEEKRSPLIIDLGTGSGAIIISLAKELKRLFPRPFTKMEFVADDISLAALRLAQTNARRHKLNRKIKFFRGNLLAPIITRLKNRELIIAANLPYLTPAQIKNSPTIKREPRLALNGGPDGLKYYRRLFRQLKDAPFSGATIFCEISPRQDKEISNLAKKYWLAAEIETKKDLAGKKRLVIIKLKND